MNTKTKLSKKQIDAVAHNLIVGTVLEYAWDFVTKMQVGNEFDYAFVNSACEDYCDTLWQTTQNVKLGESLMLIDAKDMADTAYDNYTSNLVGNNIAEISVGDVYASMDEISGDTAMRESYYSDLEQHFRQMCSAETGYELRDTEYKGNYELVSTHSAKQKEALVREYLDKYDAYKHIELSNELPTW